MLWLRQINAACNWEDSAASFCAISNHCWKKNIWIKENKAFCKTNHLYFNEETCDSDNGYSIYFFFVVQNVTEKIKIDLIENNYEWICLWPLYLGMHVYNTSKCIPLLRQLICFRNEEKTVWTFTGKVAMLSFSAEITFCFLVIKLLLYFLLTVYILKRLFKKLPKTK